MRDIERRINEKYGAGTAKLTVREQYRNMAEVLTERMDIIERAKRAMEKARHRAGNPPGARRDGRRAALVPRPALPEPRHRRQRFPRPL